MMEAFTNVLAHISEKGKEADRCIIFAGRTMTVPPYLSYLQLS